MGHFLVRLHGFQEETLCAQMPTAPRWKAQIETCQETRRKVVSGEWAVQTEGLGVVG